MRTSISSSKSGSLSAFICSSIGRFFIHGQSFRQKNYLFNPKNKKDVSLIL
jgi:hypothetical protein